MTEAPLQIRPGFTAPPKVDWFRVLADLQTAGLCNAEVARRLGLTAQRLNTWKLGHQPAHGEGDSLLALYRWVHEREPPKINQ